MSTRIQLRRSTAANWTSTNPTLASGEPGFETDTGKFKIGDGTTAWNSLAYETSGSTAGGDLSGSYPNPTVAKLNGVAAASYALKASPTFTGTTTAPEFTASGLTGATSASRYAGATASGAPASGTFVVGDYVVDRTGSFWVCTTAGSPGSWTQVESGTSGTPSGTAGGGLAGTYPNPTVNSLMPVLNVKDAAYGAVGNSTTNDQAAIQSALNAVPSTGGIVYFPIGKYKINTAITPKALTILRGEHPGGSQDGGSIITTPEGSVIMCGAAIASMINITDVRGVQLQNLAVHGKNLATTCITSDGYGHGSRVENCVISNATTQNILVTATTNYNGEFHVLDSQLTMNNASYNILVDGTGGAGAGDVQVTGNVMRGASLAHVRCIGGGGNMIMGNHVYANPATQVQQTAGFWLDSTGHDQIQNNYIDQVNGGPSIKLTSGNGGSAFLTNTIILGNKSYNQGISVDNTNPVILLDASAGGKIRNVAINSNLALGGDNTHRYNYFIQSVTPANVLAFTATGNICRWAAAMWSTAPDAFAGNLLTTGSPETITAF